MSRMTLEQFADRVHELLPVIMRIFSSRQKDELISGKISLPQFFILDYLNRKTEAKMTDLARVVNVTTAAMTGMVDKLVGSGYCVRVFDEHDRRVIKVRLTSKGMALVRQIHQKRRQTLVHIFGKICEDERENYLRILQHIYDIMIQENEAAA